MVKSDDGRIVPVVQAYAFGKYLGYLNVTFDVQGNVIKASGNPILLKSSIPEGMLKGWYILGCGPLGCNTDAYFFSIVIKVQDS